jgi:hypothetical protein
MHIRDDTNNELLLRTRMLPSDLQAIRDAASEFTIPARLLRIKMARELIYEPLYQECLERLRRGELL